MDSMIRMAVGGLAGAGMAAVLVPLTLRWHRARSGGNSVRDLHHTHSESISRMGGLSLAVPFVLAAGVVFSFGLVDSREAPEIFIVVLGALAMFALGFWDDLKPLGARFKLLGQLVIATGVCLLGLNVEQLSNPLGEGAIHLGMWGVVVTVVWLVAFTNLINLIDGLDGLAGGLSLMLIGLLAYLRIQSGSAPDLCMVVVGALLVFLRYNFPPARIYLGDGGAYLLGFFIAALTIVSSQKGTVAAALIAPLFVLTLPMIDVSLAILRRGLKGLPIFRPDRGHIHHKLLEMGMSRRRAVLSLYAFTLLFLGIALVFLWGKGRTLPILIGFGALCLVLIAGQFDFSREWFAVGRVLGNSMGMREEVGFALSVTRWLQREVSRVQSMEEFWKLMTFAAERLGFTSLTLELRDGRREWSVESPPLAFHHRRFDFRHCGAGVLELRSRVCRHGDIEQGDPAGTHGCGRSVACVGDWRVFSIVGELLAEVWHKASQELCPADSSLQFDSRFNQRRHSGTAPFRWLRRLNRVVSTSRRST